MSATILLILTQSIHVHVAQSISLATQAQASRLSNTSTASSLVVSHRANDDPAKKNVRRLMII